MAGKLIGVCVGIFRWFPVVFVTAIIVWSYYAYVVHMCLCKFVAFFHIISDSIKYRILANILYSRNKTDEM